MADHGTPLQPETTMRGQQRIAGYLRVHRAIAQDEVGQDGEHGTTRGALDAPDAHPTQPDTHIMRVACPASTALTSRLVLELKAESHDAGEDTFEERLPIAKQLEVRRFASEIDGDGAVFSRRLSCYAHVSPPGHQVLVS
jgi:hypothetical protein